ncbi:hypothetical protein EEL32_04150 [Brevibacillus laterosporus]|nr:hypothetical protein EEL32_23070 [Brevibacillus laterosporus]TPG88391.1 hypothetical protein EEL32_09560 [Brevibacillus laterosporus]TPG90152.1 hypothetical protein EEL32_04150 [Brevibacillus laterosporus]
MKVSKKVENILLIISLLLMFILNRLFDNVRDVIVFIFGVVWSSYFLYKLKTNSGKNRFLSVIGVVFCIVFTLYFGYLAFL